MNLTKDKIPYTKIDRIVDENISQPSFSDVFNMKTGYERMRALSKVPMLKMFLYRVYQSTFNSTQDEFYATKAVEAVASGIIELNNYSDFNLTNKGSYLPTISILDLIAGYKIYSGVSYLSIISGLSACFKDVNKVDMDLYVLDLIPAIIKTIHNFKSIGDYNVSGNTWKSLSNFFLDQIVSGQVDSHKTIIVIDNFETTLAKIPSNTNIKYAKRLYEKIIRHIIKALGNTSRVHNVKLKYVNTYITVGKLNVIRFLRNIVNILTTHKKLYRVMKDNALDYRNVNDMFTAYNILVKNPKISLGEFSRLYEKVDTNSNDRVLLERIRADKSNYDIISYSSFDSSMMSNKSDIASLHVDRIIEMSTSLEELESLLDSYSDLCIKLMNINTPRVLRKDTIDYLIRIHLSDPDYEDVIDKVVKEVCARNNSRYISCTWEIVYE